MSAIGTKGWTLAALRRDRGLFALVGICIILLGTVLSPTGAFAAQTGGKLICAFADDDETDNPTSPSSTAAEHCAACLAARSGFDDLPPVDLGQGAPAFEAPQRIADIAPPVVAIATEAPSRPGDPPPLIRGPPSFA